MSTFNIGDKVSRLENVYDQNSRLMHGIVTRVYSRPKRDYGNDIVLGPYPELYEVKWNDGNIGRAYLPHGLIKE